MFPEFSKTPFYVSNTNMLIPLINYVIYDLIAIAYEIISISCNAILFVICELLNIIELMEYNEIIVICLLIGYIVFDSLVKYELNNKWNDIDEYIKQLEMTIELNKRDLIYLKNIEKLRENMDQTWSEEFRFYYEQSKKIKEMEIQMEKMKEMEIQMDKMKTIEKQFKKYKNYLKDNYY